MDELNQLCVGIGQHKNRRLEDMYVDHCRFHSKIQWYHFAHLLPNFCDSGFSDFPGTLKSAFTSAV